MITARLGFALFVFGGVYFGLLSVMRAIPFEVINAILRREPPPEPPVLP